MPWRHINYNVPGTTSTRQYQILRQTAPRVKIFSCVLQKATLLFMTWLLEVMWLIMALQHWTSTQSLRSHSLIHTICLLCKRRRKWATTNIEKCKDKQQFYFLWWQISPRNHQVKHETFSALHYFVLCFLFICEFIWVFFLIRKCENKMKINLTIMNLTTHRNLPVISNSFVFCSRFSNFLLPEVFSGPCSTLRWPHLL